MMKKMFILSLGLGNGLSGDMTLEITDFAEPDEKGDTYLVGITN